MQQICQSLKMKYKWSKNNNKPISTLITTLLVGDAFQLIVMIWRVDDFPSYDISDDEKSNGKQV